METILVGVDESANARSALRWAIEHAAADDEIIALHVWHLPPVVGFDAGVLDPAVFEEAARLTTREVVDAVAGDAGVAADRVGTRIVAGHTAEVLIEQGRDADLLVVGSRGRGGFAELLLGSVASNVAKHAPCPVVIVPLTDAS